MNKRWFTAVLNLMSCILIVGFFQTSVSYAAPSSVAIGGNTLDNQNIGALSMSWEFQSTGSFQGASPVAALGHIFVANKLGQVVALDASGLNGCTYNAMDLCTPQYTFATPLNTPVYATPVVSGSVLFVSVGDVVDAFDALVHPPLNRSRILELST